MTMWHKLRLVLKACMLLLALLIFSTAEALQSAQVGDEYSIILIHDLPPQARATLERIKAGGPFPYRKDGSVFGNREGRLPKRTYGYYSEYTVVTPGAEDRGARRIIAGAGKQRDVRLSGEYYYTDDHYQTFKRILER